MKAKTQNYERAPVKDGERLWVGDPSYILGADNWSCACDFLIAAGCDDENQPREHVYRVELDGGAFFVAKTQHGAGNYKGKTGQSYSVEAGMLAIVPENMITGDYAEFGTIFKMKRGNVELRCEKDGSFIFRNNGEVIESIDTEDIGCTGSIIDDILGQNDEF
jgi:hypothetical protein